MSDVTRILNAIDQGDQRAVDALLPLVYEELRVLASQKLYRELPGQTLQATALVHEAYIRLVGGEAPSFENRRHFFGAAAEAMRRILVETARHKKRQKRGGSNKRMELNDACLAVESAPDTLLIFDEALTRLSQIDDEAAKLVRLSFYGGLTLQQGADLLGISRRTAFRYWAFARAWLHNDVSKGDEFVPAN